MTSRLASNEITEALKDETDRLTNWSKSEKERLNARRVKELAELKGSKEFNTTALKGAIEILKKEEEAKEQEVRNYPELVNVLKIMGLNYDEGRVTAALRQAGGNLDLALDILEKAE